MGTYHVNFYRCGFLQEVGINIRSVHRAIGKIEPIHVVTCSANHATIDSGEKDLECTLQECHNPKAA